MDNLTSVAEPLDCFFLGSLYGALLLCGGTIIVILVRVVPNAEQKKGYYFMIFSQSVADFLQGGLIVSWVSNYSFKIKYVGLFLFLLSCMLTAYLAVYWMDVLNHGSNNLKRTLLWLMSVMATPAIIMSIYLIVVKNSSQDISSREWLIYCGSKVIAQSFFSLVVMICLIRVHKISRTFRSATTRRAHRKVAIGLAYKSIGSLLIALFSVYTIVEVLQYRSLLRFIQENPWWEKVYFVNTNVYSGVNGIVTCWILSRMICAPFREARPKESRAISQQQIILLDTFSTNRV